MAEIQQTVQSGAAVELRAGVLRGAGMRSLQMLAALVLIGAVMMRIEFAGPAILDNDGYYHIRWSKLLRESAPHLPKFTNLPLTTLSEERYVDHHFLFHVLLIPFTFGDLRLGAKLAAAVFSTLGIAMCFWVLVAYRVRFRWLWIVPLVASSEPFLYRMAMTRDPSLSLLVLGLGSYIILERRWVLLGILGFVFVWLYSLFPLLLAFAAAYTIALYIGQRRVDLRAPLAACAGIGAGLIVNPYFPKNITLFIEHVKMKLSSTYAVDVGVEWYPYETWVILGGSAVAFAIFFVALLAFDFRHRSKDIKPLFFLIVSSMLLLIAFKSRRFIEYWPPFAVLFAAFTITPRLSRIFPGRSGSRLSCRETDASDVLEGEQVSGLGDTVRAGIAATPTGMRQTPVPGQLMRRRDRVIVAIAAAVITQALVFGMISNVEEAGKEVATEQDPSAFEGAGHWLAEHTPPGSMVFNTDWDEFPMLFYYDTNNSYIVGLDPTYLYDRDHDMWKEYAEITLGNVEDPGPAIRERFGADYVVTDNAHSDFMETVDQSGGFEKVFSDKYTTVLRVKGPVERRGKPAENSDDSGAGDDDEEK